MTFTTKKVPRKFAGKRRFSLASSTEITKVITHQKVDRGGVIFRETRKTRGWPIQIADLNFLHEKSDILPFSHFVN